MWVAFCLYFFPEIKNIITVTKYGIYPVLQAIKIKSIYEIISNSQNRSDPRKAMFLRVSGIRKKSFGSYEIFMI